jgi:anhydro-N-acetylmuramic acid kinase
MMHSDLYIGLMSGTSLDGVDGVLCRIDAQGQWAGVLAHAHHPFERALRQQLLDLQQPGSDELHRAMLAGNALARVYARTCAELLDDIDRTTVRAVGVHGQTVRHQPGLHDGTGYTVQLNQPALLAELTGIDVIADFRSRDVAAGGQGAPLVPPFHQALFGSAAAPGHRAVVNIGGISNLTVLPDGADSALRGFDCGPGNALLDHWCLRHLGHEFDAGGQWAASGRVVPDLLTGMLTEPYFSALPPKSTGRDLFNPVWLEKHLAHLPVAPSAQDVQATLSELTARSIAADVLRHAPAADTLVVCGGGAFNADLRRRLQAALPGRQIRPSDDFGLPALQVEAAAFAWLACMHCQRRPASSAAVTGAAGARILGACYPA